MGKLFSRLWSVDIMFVWTLLVVATLIGYLSYLGNLTEQNLVDLMHDGGKLVGGYLACRLVITLVDTLMKPFRNND